MKIWFRGRIGDGQDARVSVMDHGLLYGDGVFEGLRAVGGKLVDLDLHLRRLQFSAKAIYLELPMSTEQLRDVVLSTAAANQSDEAYLRLVVTRGAGRLGIDTGSCVEPEVVCIADTLDLFGGRGAAGLRLVTASWRRPDPDVLDPRVKSLNYLNNVINKHEAKQRGADEALVLNRRGHIAEASSANVFIRRGDELLTPPATDGALEGITRRRVLLLAERAGLVAREVTLSRLDLLSADEAFLTGTGAGLVPIVALDGQEIPRGTATPRLQVLNREYAAEHGTPFAEASASVLLAARAL